MKKTTRYAIFCALLAGAFLAGTWYDGRPVAATAERPSRYVCPMHPQYVSERPGTAPCCGMKLEKVGAGQSLPQMLPAGAVAVSESQQQRFGIRVATVQKSAAEHTLRLTGRVAPDESKLFKMIAGIEGVFHEVANVTTGSEVKKGEWLGTIFSQDIRPVQQAYLTSLDILDREQKSGREPGTLRLVQEGAESAYQRVVALGVGAAYADELKRTRQIPPLVKLSAPASGFVLSRNATPGQRFERGSEWYRIADLSRVWVLADTFGEEASYLRPGTRTKIRIPGRRVLVDAVVSNVLPQFDAGARTLKVRLEASNPGFALRPDMFVDVEAPVAAGSAMMLPSSAILDSGMSKRVFVESAPGVFEPRAVETGARLGDRVEIVIGVSEGERVAVSGNFLLDSESRMRAAVQNSRDPICGMQVAAGRAAAKAVHEGKTYYFCSRSCKDEFSNKHGGRS